MTPTIIERNVVGFPEYHGRNRFPKKQAKGFCRGCRGPITEKYRKTWCSNDCKKKFDPFFVKQEVRRRDKVCVFCGQLGILEFDHITPHSEGGLFTVENIRLLCADCHKKRTAEWRRSKADIGKREAKQGVLI